MPAGAEYVAPAVEMHDERQSRPAGRDCRFLRGVATQRIAASASRRPASGERRGGEHPEAQVLLLVSGGSRFAN
jgi:hypothetical protein